MRSEILEQIKGLAYGFGSVAEPYPAALNPWRKNAPQWKQTHGTRLVRISKAHAECGECDALSTAEHEVPVVVATADCVPVILVRRDPSGHAQEIAAIHAGWRGTLAKIVEQTARTLIHASPASLKATSAQEWSAILGPSIGPCCFEVGDEVRTPFIETFGESIARGAATESHNLDLWSVNEAQLRTVGITTIERLDVCTRCASMPDGSPRYHSFRRERGGTRQWSGAVLLR